MKAVRVFQYGSLDVLQCTDIPRPEPGVSEGAPYECTVETDAKPRSAFHKRNGNLEDSSGRGQLELARSGESCARVQPWLFLAQPHGVSARSPRSHRVSHPEVGGGTGLPPHQRALVIRRQQDRCPLRLRVARRFRPMVSILWQ